MDKQKFIGSNLITVCKNILKENKDILSIILSGSRARGDFRKDSDYDIMFITKRGGNYKLKEKYQNLISKKTKIDIYLIQIYLWQINYFKKEYRKGNSFIYCALRDGKILASRYNANLKMPKNCKKSAIDRLDSAKRCIETIKSYSKILKKDRKFRLRLELENLGYCAMHLCWFICMFNNFCPKSKYTTLIESKKYFTKEEYKIIKKCYEFYADNDYKNIQYKTFLKLYKNLQKIISHKQTLTNHFPKNKPE